MNHGTEVEFEDDVSERVSVSSGKVEEFAQRTIM